MNELVDKHFFITHCSVRRFFSFVNENISILEPENRSNSSCPNVGVYQTFSDNNSVVSSCSTGGQRILSIGCSTNEKTNELTLTSSCRHDLIVDVQLITSINGICLATWRVDQRFQRTLVLYENDKAFCLVRSFVFSSFTFDRRF